MLGKRLPALLQKPAKPATPQKAPHSVTIGKPLLALLPRPAKPATPQKALQKVITIPMANAPPAMLPIPIIKHRNRYLALLKAILKNMVLLPVPAIPNTILIQISQRCIVQTPIPFCLDINITYPDTPSLTFL